METPMNIFQSREILPIEEFDPDGNRLHGIMDGIIWGSITMFLANPPQSHGEYEAFVRQCAVTGIEMLFEHGVISDVR